MKASTAAERGNRTNNSASDTGAQCSGINWIGEDCQTGSNAWGSLTRAHQILSVSSVTRTGLPPSRTSKITSRTLGWDGHAKSVDPRVAECWTGDKMESVMTTDTPSS